MQSIRRSANRIQKSEIRTPSGRIHIEEGLANKSVGTPIERATHLQQAPSYPSHPIYKATYSKHSTTHHLPERTWHLQNNAL